MWRAGNRLPQRGDSFVCDLVHDAGGTRERHCPVVRVRGRARASRLRSRTGPRAAVDQAGWRPRVTHARSVGCCRPRSASIRSRLCRKSLTATSWSLEACGSWRTCHGPFLVDTSPNRVRSPRRTEIVRSRSDLLISRRRGLVRTLTAVGVSKLLSVPSLASGR
jgi:hypothetical protein